MAELMGMFRRIGPSDEQARLRRVMPLGTKVWLTITDPAEGLLVRSSDLLLDAGTLQAFEEERDLLRRPASTIGASPRYDWDAMYAWLTWFLFEKGVPDTQMHQTVLSSKSEAELDGANVHVRSNTGEELRMRELRTGDGWTAIGIRHDLPDDLGRVWRTECVLKRGAAEGGHPGAPRTGCPR